MTSKFNRIILSAAALAVLSACSGESQDDGNADKTFVSGRAVDGPIAQAYVYLDTNGNNMLDGWESYALTDEDGYFSYNPNKLNNGGTVSDTSDDVREPYDYCLKGGYIPDEPAGKPEDKTTQAYADYIASADYVAYVEAKNDGQYCLGVPAGIVSGPLRVATGLDLTTSQGLIGSLTYEVNVTKTNYKTPLVITPITSMLHAAQETDSVYPLNEAITDSAKLKMDYMNFDPDYALTDDERKNLAHMAMMAQKPAGVLSNLVELKTTNKFGGSSTDSPFDMMPFVQAEAARLVTDTKTMSAVLTANATEITNAASLAVSTQMIDMASGDTFAPPASIIVSDIVARFSSNGGLPAFIDNLFDDALGAITMEQYITQRLRAVEIVASLMRGRKLELLGTTITPYFAPQAAIDQAMTAALTDPAYLTNIGHANADVAAIVGIFEDGAYVDATSVDFSSRVSFNDQFVAVDGGNALNLVSSDGGDTFGFVFHDDGTATVDFKLGGETAYSTGEQQTVTTTYEQVDDNTIVMNMELIPGTGIYQPVTLKTNKDGTGYTVDSGSGPEEFVTQP